MSHFLIIVSVFPNRRGPRQEEDEEGANPVIPGLRDFILRYSFDLSSFYGVILRVRAF